jgi:hypothetical protein
LADSLANATDDVYAPEHLKAAVKRFLQVARYDDPADCIEALAEVAQITAGLWKSYKDRE